MSDQARPPTLGHPFKAAVTGKARRKATVRGYLAGTEPVVELRVLRDRDRGDAIDLTFPQARQLVRLLLDAIEHTAELARHDGKDFTSRDRESLAGASSHVRSQAEA